jgi:Na+/H+-dicarboxylate symporter
MGSRHVHFDRGNAVKKIFQSLYVQVLIAITIGVLLGHF